jgi:hypothetical protein
MGSTVSLHKNFLSYCEAASMTGPVPNKAVTSA